MPDVVVKARPNLMGATFDRLTVVSRAAKSGPADRWRCKCSCNGKLLPYSLTTQALTGPDGRKSCGCLAKENCKKNAKAVADIFAARNVRIADLVTSGRSVKAVATYYGLSPRRVDGILDEFANGKSVR